MQWLNTLFDKIGRMFNWFFTVVPWERAVRVRLGKHTALLGPGIHLQIPFIDKIYVQNVKVRVTATSAQALTTSDGHTITLQAAVRFHILDVVQLYATLYNVDDTLNQEVEGHFSDYIITHKVADCIPKKVLAYVTKRTNFEQYGLKVSNIFLTDFVRVKTYRLIQGGLENYANAGISTSRERRTGAPGVDY